MNTKTTPKDFFLHLAATVVLYVAAGSLINLWFAVINYFHPDALAGYFYGNSVAWPISMLVVLVPALYIIEWLIGRDMARMPEKRDLWIRRWRIYLTIFLAAALMIGDLIALVNVYLNGEITARFIYKIVVILLTAGAVGKYYFFSLYPDLRWSKVARKVNPWFGVIFSLAAVILGFIAVGSPATQRALRFDAERTSDLQTIQWQVLNYWQQKGELPADLDALEDPLAYLDIPTDPETEDAYGYSVTSSSSEKPAFELCAVFSRPSRDGEGRGAYGGRGGIYPMAYDMVSYPAMDGGDNWKHGEGLTCFDRSIDPDKYPVNKPVPLEPRAI